MTKEKCTGGVVIGYLSALANLVYLILDVELVLLFNLQPSEERRQYFGSHINEINTSSPAFPIVLFALIASFYGVIASLLLVCGSLCVSSTAYLTFGSSLLDSLMNLTHNLAY